MAALTRASRLLVASRGVSVLGDRFAEVALPLAFLDRTGELVLAGLFGALNSVPGLVVPHALGRMVDRFDRGRLLVTADLGRCAAYGAVAFVIGADWLPVALAAPLALLTGALDVLGSIAGNAAVVEATPPESLLAANSRLESADAAASLVGPALGGAVVALASPATALVVDAVSFAASGAVVALALGGVGGRRHPTGASATRSAATEASPASTWRTTYRLVLGSVELRTAVVATAVLGFHSGGIVVTLVAIGERALDLPAAGIGAVVSAAGAGALASSLLVAPRLGGVAWPRALLATLAASVAGLAFVGVAPSFGALLVATLAMDGAVSGAFVVAGTVRQSASPRPALGQVNAAVLQVGALMRVAGSALAGVTAGFLTGRAAVLAPTLALVVAMAVVGPVMRRRATALAAVRPRPRAECRPAGTRAAPRATGTA